MSVRPHALCVCVSVCLRAVRYAEAMNGARSARWVFGDGLVVANVVHRHDYTQYYTERVRTGEAGRDKSTQCDMCV